MKSKMFLQRLFVIFSILILLFSLSACGKEQQGRQPSFPVTEYVSSTELFRLYVPTGWKTQEVIPGSDVVVANTESALSHYRSESALESGELVLNIGFLPLALFQEQALAHLDIQIEASPDVFLQSILAMFLVGGEPAVDAASESVLVSLVDGRDAGMLIFAKEGREGMLLVFKAGKDVFVFVSVITFPGGMVEFQDIAYEVAAGVTYDGSGSALYSKLNGK